MNSYLKIRKYIKKPIYYLIYIKGIIFQVVNVHIVRITVGHNTF